MSPIVKPLPGTFDQITEAMTGHKITKEFTVVSLFSGCGGLDLGFLGGFHVFGQTYDRLPFRITWANDINPAACITYRTNLRETIYSGDIRELFDQVPQRADVVIGGFPCTDISVNGKRTGVDGDSSGLYKEMVKVVAQCKPKVFVAENVKGLLLDYNKESLRQVLSDFESLGYAVSYHLYNAADYGVPQVRERVFIVGTAKRVKAFRPPLPVLVKGAWLTSQEAIGDLETVEENHANNHVWSRAASSPDQGQRKIKADCPATTIRAEHHGNIQFHYTLPRRLSIREAARLQSFPDNFIFSKGMREAERQIGNAVPPVLAWHIASAVRNCLV